MDILREGLSTVRSPPPSLLDACTLADLQLLRGTIACDVSRCAPMWGLCMLRCLQ